jgi:hypothetical protein
MDTSIKHYMRMKFSAKLHPAVISQKIQITLCNQKQRGKNYRGSLKVKSFRGYQSKIRVSIESQVSIESRVPIGRIGRTGIIVVS